MHLVQYCLIPGMYLIAVFTGSRWRKGSLGASIVSTWYGWQPLFWWLALAKELWGTRVVACTAGMPQGYFVALFNKPGYVGATASMVVLWGCVGDVFAGLRCKFGRGTPLGVCW